VHLFYDHSAISLADNLLQKTAKTASNPAFRLPASEITVADEPDAESGDKALDGGARQRRELLLLAVTRH
jgi:hypothetical protein